MTETEKILEALKKQDEATVIRDEKLTDIHFAIFGNERAGVDGIAKKVSYHDKYIRADKKLKYVGAGIMMTSGAGLWESIKMFFKI